MSRSAMKQRRGRSSELISSTLMQVGTHQKLFMETHMCTIYRVTLVKSEQFSEAKAQSLIEKYHKKRQAHCTCRLLEDRISLEKTKTTGKTPFRPWVGYREITHLYLGQSKPELLVLCIDSQKSAQRYYEIYKCKSSDGARKVEELIRRAMNDPDKLLRDAVPLGQVTVTDNDRVRSLAQFEMQENRETVIENGMYAYPPSPEPEIRAVEPTKQILVSSGNRMSPEIPFDHLNGLHDLTYIALDPKRGARASTRGPIYMFVERLKNNHGDHRRDHDDYYNMNGGDYGSRY